MYHVLGYLARCPKRPSAQRGQQIMQTTLHNYNRFPLGRMLGTPGALAALEQAGESPIAYLSRHVRGDWGNVCPEDAQANEDALRDDTRIFSVYTTSRGEKLWVVTEADRSATTLL